MKRFFFFSFLIIGFYQLISCAPTQPQDDIICSTIYKSIDVGINGQQLDRYYTIRISDGDTLKYEDPNESDSFYPVITDAYHSNLVNKKDSFHFVGFSNGSIIVEQAYIIGGDECHIYLHKGPETIDL
ncbi:MULTISPECIES: hypothetical protein [unclassified Aureispira]|uniref:hypothetical protein n=1 Tax=unclassified Aureispira TaxID=2649989 RepID=UPI0006965BD0|nr:MULTISPECIES: hypothetical protein [unclassified Aureispira]WMX12545.1 hypothetical protein QP953_17080 [Aureispira sp. CCB-E]